MVHARHFAEWYAEPMNYQPLVAQTSGDIVRVPPGEARALRPHKSSARKIRMNRFFSYQGHRDPSISDPGLSSLRTVVSSSVLIANSRDAGILIIQLRCNSLCRAPERWPARPVYFPARRVGAPVRMAAAAERRIRVASTWPGMARRTAAASASLPEGMGSAMSTRPRSR